MKETKHRRYVPALGINLLTPLYDPLVRVSTRERLVKSAVIEQADVASATRILDVGCGTATLLKLTRECAPQAQLVGIDGDHRILRIAASKVASLAPPLAFTQALSSALPFGDQVFDRVFSTLMLHHLTHEEKRDTLRETFRVLRPEGELHVADWGRPHNVVMTVASIAVRLGDGLGRTADNVAGRIPILLKEAGFEQVRETRAVSTVFGTLQLYCAMRPGPRGRV